MKPARPKARDTAEPALPGRRYRPLEGEAPQALRGCFIPPGHFRAISKHVPLRPIRSERDYDAAVRSLNALLDAGAADEGHALADLAATLGELIGDYDDAHYPAKDVAPSDMLRFLMDQHGIRQTDLSQELGSQGVVSEILNGKRELNLRQMRALAGRFAVPVAAFVDGVRAAPN